jgi:hypothetical protein
LPSATGCVAGFVNLDKHSGRPSFS